MPRRTIFILILGIVVSFVCYRRAERNIYVRYFAQALQEIDDNYIEPVDDQKLFEGAMTGMVGELDRYSGFIRQQQAGDFQRMVLDQKFGGIGIEVTYDKQSRELKVLTPIYGTPAYKAGIQAGDRIVAVDGHDTRALETRQQADDAIELLRGEPGQPVTLEILHPGRTEPVRYQLVRREIHVDSVLGDVRNPDDTWSFLLPGYDRIGYVRIMSFGERTVDELRAALATLERQEARGLILDLRSDPGGLLKAAIGVAELFLDRGDPIVSTRGRNPNIKREEFRADEDGPYRNLPLVVLVNHESASASEIVAAALQDRGRALVAGERTFGKGTVQNVIPLEGNKSKLKLTIATYWRPSGQNIHRLESSKKSDEWGVKPNPQCEVKMSAEEFARWELRRRQRDIIQPKGQNPPQAAAEPAAGPPPAGEQPGPRAPTETSPAEAPLPDPPATEAKPEATTSPDSAPQSPTAGPPQDSPPAEAPAGDSPVTQPATDVIDSPADDPQLQKAVECLEHEVRAKAHPVPVEAMPAADVKRSHRLDGHPA